MTDIHETQIAKRINTGSTALERSVNILTGGLKHIVESDELITHSIDLRISHFRISGLVYIRL